MGRMVHEPVSSIVMVEALRKHGAWQVITWGSALLFLGGIVATVASVKGWVDPLGPVWLWHFAAWTPPGWVIAFIHDLGGDGVLDSLGDHVIRAALAVGLVSCAIWKWKTTLPSALRRRIDSEAGEVGEAFSELDLDEEDDDLEFDDWDVSPDEAALASASPDEVKAAIVGGAISRERFDLPPDAGWIERRFWNSLSDAERRTFQLVGDSVSAATWWLVRLGIGLVVVLLLAGTVNRMDFRFDDTIAAGLLILAWLLLILLYPTTSGVGTGLDSAQSAPPQTMPFLCGFPVSLDTTLRLERRWWWYRWVPAVVFVALIYRLARWALDPMFGDDVWLGYPLAAMLFFEWWRPIGIARSLWLGPSGRWRLLVIEVLLTLLTVTIFVTAMDSFLRGLVNNALMNLFFSLSADWNWKLGIVLTGLFLGYLGLWIARRRYRSGQLDLIGKSMDG